MEKPAEAIEWGINLGSAEPYEETIEAICPCFRTGALSPRGAGDGPGRRNGQQGAGQRGYGTVRDRALR